MNVLIFPFFEADNVLTIVLFFPDLSLNVLINKVLSQRYECKKPAVPELRKIDLRHGTVQYLSQKLFKNALYHTIKACHALDD